MRDETCDMFLVSVHCYKLFELQMGSDRNVCEQCDGKMWSFIQ
jgi:hypothetical protein